MSVPDAGPEAGRPQSLEEQARLIAEQVRLQAVMIELLNEQLRGCRGRIERQAERIEDLKRMIRVRDDLLQLRNEPPRNRPPRNELPAAAVVQDRGPWHWLARLVRGSQRG
jgi:hypothetical protein